jgi:hypothetical protein
MSDADRVASFLALAQEDLKAARLLKAGVPRQAAFFLQQAAQRAFTPLASLLLRCPIHIR